MISSPYLDGRTRYERVIEGWVDNTHEDAFTHTVQASDDDGAVEVSAVCTSSPEYRVVEARARALAGVADPGFADAFGDLAGARMIGGFGRVLGEICGDRPGAPLFADAALEIARLARQVTRLPAAMSAVVADGDATACWNLDTTGWVDLPGSCFTYSAAGRSMLATRHVTTPMERSLYSPPPGARKVFRRKRLLRLVQTDRRLHLFHSMHDNVHGFDVHFEIDLDASEIVAADSVTSRLP